MMTMATKRTKEKRKSLIGLEIASLTNARVYKEDAQLSVGRSHQHRRFSRASMQNAAPRRQHVTTSNLGDSIDQSSGTEAGIPAAAST